MRKSVLLSASLAIAGLLLATATSPTAEATPTPLPALTARCDGPAATTGVLVRAFYSKRGAFIGVLAEGNASALVRLPPAALFAGDRVRVAGRAARYRGACWLFADEVRLLD